MDTELFPEDLIADYFQSVAPLGYKSLYRLGASLGIDPITFNKLLPLILSVLTAAYCFWVCISLFPLPFAGFVASSLLSQNIWLYANDLSSATSRAFLYPLFLAFLYYLIRNKTIACIFSLLLLGCFYPQLLLVALGILTLRLLDINKFSVCLTPHWRQWLLWGAGIASVLLVLLLEGDSEFRPVYSAIEAKTLSELSLAGARNAFFVGDRFPIYFWLLGDRSGLIANPEKIFAPFLILSGLGLPLVASQATYFPLIKRIRRQIVIIPQILLASFGLFLTAHLLLFQLHLPSRYTQHSLRVVMAIAAGITLVTMLDAVLSWLRKSRLKSIIKLVLTLLITLFSIWLLLIRPWGLARSDESIRFAGYVQGNYPELYQFLERQSKDIVVASLDAEASNLTTFSKRSTFVAPEYSIPYHKGYYEQFRERVVDLIEAQYAESRAGIVRFLEKYKIDYWLVNQEAFSAEYIKSSNWLHSYRPASSNAIARLGKTSTLPLATLAIYCNRLQEDDLILLDAKCLLRQSQLDAAPLQIE